MNIIKFTMRMPIIEHMDIEEYRKEIIVPDSWNYERSNSRFMTGEYQIVNPTHVKTALKKIEFHPTINFRGDYANVCDRLGVIPHPRLIKAQSPHFEYYCTVQTADKVAYDIIERQKLASELPGGLFPEKDVNLSSIRLDIPSFSVFTTLLCSRPSSIETLSISNCNLDAEHIYCLSDLATSPENGQFFPPVLKLDYNITQVTANTYMHIRENIDNIIKVDPQFANLVTQARKEVAGFFWRRIRKLCPVRPTLERSATSSIYAQWDTTRDDRLDWREWLVGMDDAADVDAFQKHLGFALLDVFSEGFVRRESFEELVGAAEVSEVESKAGGASLQGGSDNKYATIGEVVPYIEPICVSLGKFTSGKCLNIKILSLRNFGVDRRHITAIANGLRTNTTLRVLNLANNNIDDVCCSLLGTALYEHNRTLTHLDLSDNNNITDVGLFALLQCLGAAPVTDLKNAQALVKDVQTKAGKALQLLEKEEAAALKAMEKSSKDANAKKDENSNNLKSNSFATPGLIGDGPRINGDNPNEENGAFLTLHGSKNGLKERLEELTDIYGQLRCIQFRNCSLSNLNFSRCTKIRDWENILLRSAYGEVNSRLILEGTSATSDLQEAISVFAKKNPVAVNDVDINLYWEQKIELLINHRQQQLAAANAASTEILSNGKKGETKGANNGGKDSAGLVLDNEWAPLNRKGWNVQWW